MEYNEPEAMRVFLLLLEQLAPLTEYDRQRIIAAIAVYYSKERPK